MNMMIIVKYTIRILLMGLVLVSNAVNATCSCSPTAGESCSCATSSGVEVCQVIEGACVCSCSCQKK